MRKNLSILLLILGIGSFTFGSYMSNEAEQGAEKVSQAEEKVEDRRKPLIGPVRKSVSASATEVAQEKISTEAQKVGKSQVSANWLQGIGIALFVVGLSSVAYNFSRKRKR